jgi:PAS domain S-box-containing protein
MQNSVSLREAHTILRKEKDCVLIGDIWGYISDVNRTLLKFFGAKNKKEIVGKHVLNFLIEEERARATENSVASIKSNEGKTETYKVRMRSGEIALLQVETILIADRKGSGIGFVDIVKLANQP